MSSVISSPLEQPGFKRSRTARLEEYVARAIDDLILSLPDPDTLSWEERRGIIARYSTVLEGNFVYWMTATVLAVASDTARAIVEENLREEIRDNHPGMLRRFAMAARALPTEADMLAVHEHLAHVRRFVARPAGPNILLMMAFFEGFITRFMPYLAELARRQESSEREYTDVHGIVDVEHSKGLFRALSAEMAYAPMPLPGTANLLYGVEALRALIERIICPHGAGEVAFEPTLQGAVLA
jgi:hypothetical protein